MSLKKKLAALPKARSAEAEKKIQEAVDWFVAEEAAGHETPTIREVSHLLNAEGCAISESAVRNRIVKARGNVRK